jgi:hypothetical protein
LFLNVPNVLLGLQRLNTWVTLSIKMGAVDPKKVVAMQDWPHPKTLKSLHGFLGLTGYYRKFVKNYGKIVAPLTTLLKKMPLYGARLLSKAFSTLKDAMCTTPVLVMPIFH